VSDEDGFDKAIIPGWDYRYIFELNVRVFFWTITLQTVVFDFHTPSEDDRAKQHYQEAVKVAERRRQQEEIDKLTGNHHKTPSRREEMKTKLRQTMEKHLAERVAPRDVLKELKEDPAFKDVTEEEWNDLAEDFNAGESKMSKEAGL
jgi:hypothetical protein